MTGYTPIYNLPYVEPSDLVANYPTISEELAENTETAIAGSGGLSLISPTSIANSGGSASSSNGTTTFSGVSSISLNGIFSATYDNYALLFTYTVSANGTDIAARLRLSGTDNTTSNSYVYQYLIAAGTSTFVGRTTGTNWRIAGGQTALPNHAKMHLFAPAKTESTGGLVENMYANSSAGLYTTGASHNQTTAYDGITIYPESGTFTGTIRVYGYKGA